MSELSSSTQDYLKEIWTATEWSDEPVTVKQLAERLGFRASTISEGVRKLADSGFIVHQPYGAIELTEVGKAHALTMVRRHRLIETFLVQTLGYSWDEVHDEAEILEHAVSERMVSRIDKHLGHPTRDPHGDPIPAEDGTIIAKKATGLCELAIGESGVIDRISDESPEMLRFFSERGIDVGTELTKIEDHPFAASIAITLAGSDQPLTLSTVLANAIWVQPKN